KYLLKVSVFLPAPLVAIGIGTLLSSTVWAEKRLTLIQDEYGKIPTDFWVFKGPGSIQPNLSFVADLIYYVTAIVFVSAVESLLCSRMAARLAGHKGAAL